MVRRIYDVDDTRRIREVTPPIWPNARLPSEIPNLKLYVLVLDGLNIETDGGYRRDHFPNL